MNTTRRATALRAQINFLALELTASPSVAVTRCLKQAIRSAEFELTALAVAS